MPRDPATAAALRFDEAKDALKEFEGTHGDGAEIVERLAQWIDLVNEAIEVGYVSPDARPHITLQRIGNCGALVCIDARTLKLEAPPILERAEALRLLEAPLTMRGMVGELQRKAERELASGIALQLRSSMPELPRSPAGRMAWIDRLLGEDEIAEGED